MEAISNESDKNQRKAETPDSASAAFNEEREPDDNLIPSGPSTVSKPQILRRKLNYEPKTSWVTNFARVSLTLKIKLE